RTGSAPAQARGQVRNGRLPRSSAAIFTGTAGASLPRWTHHLKVGCLTQFYEARADLQVRARTPSHTLCGGSQSWLRCMAALPPLSNFEISKSFLKPALKAACFTPLPRRALNANAQGEEP